MKDNIKLLPYYAINCDEITHADLDTFLLRNIKAPKNVKRKGVRLNISDFDFEQFK